MIPKYRVWDRLRKEMNYKVMVGNCDLSDENWTCPIIWIEEEKKWLHFDDDYECIMQSTGLKDKNGKEIFEGDIVKRYRSPFFKAKWEYQIETVIKEKASLLLGREFGKNFWTIPFDSPFAESVLLEVIGNIYENPELLEDEE